MSGINDIFGIYLTDQDLKKIRRAWILIIGCGGLGSNIANMLIRTGFLNIVIVDFDVVELKNLNRQQFLPWDIGKKKVYILRRNLLKINKDANIIAVDEKIDSKKTY